MNSWYAMEVEAERRREVISEARFGGHRATGTLQASHLLDALRTRPSMSLRLAGAAGIAIAVLLQVI
jgi:hypothetical protein